MRDSTICMPDVVQVMVHLGKTLYQVPEPYIFHQEDGLVIQGHNLFYTSGDPGCHWLTPFVPQGHICSNPSLL